MITGEREEGLLPLLLYVRTRSSLDSVLVFCSLYQYLIASKTMVTEALQYCSME